MTKNNFFLKNVAIVFACFSMFNFVGCNNDNTSNHSKKYKTCDDIKSETSLFTTLNFKEANRGNPPYVEVRYVNYRNISLHDDGTYDYEIVEGTEWTDKSFLAAEVEGQTLKFKDVPDEYLINILVHNKTSFFNYSDYFSFNADDPSVKISNKNAKVAVGCIYSTNGGYGGSAHRYMSVNIEDIAGGYGTAVYCNADCDITKENQIDMHLKKGWNMIFRGGCSRDWDQITIRPDNMNIELYDPVN